MKTKDNPDLTGILMFPILKIAILNFVSCVKYYQKIYSAC